ncbi:hypothetical protein J5N97_002999 [Dioscorea zingiberensis]|uniref:glutathione transferase n=1 Tax=Dioscorea zingiberensis TaxID=325984 RepID=A0A9D5D3W8_9LILI|nr:hypothetical protein J5N97_002999 [Dioscorea zingiberensis]
MGEKGVKLFGTWVSPFSLRVELALKLKGVEYEFMDEDLQNKSQELLHYNPITKKIPVLVHNAKPLAESTVIIEYVDEAWPTGYRIMPQDPFEKAQARFWAHFIDDKCLKAVFPVYTSTGEELNKAVKEAQETLKALEKALEGKKFFSGEAIGYLDIVAGWMPYLIRMTEELAGVTVVDAGTLPLLNAWFDDFLDVDVVKSSLPPKDKLYAFNRARREKLQSGQKAH